MQDDNHNDLIGRIYETALSPGDWVDLLDTLTGWSADPVDAGGNQTSDKALGAVHVGLTFRYKRKTPS